ncbi:MAG: SDR family oxidoreductase [Lachnospiraceae bacterium]|jgi:2-deoxy-D-gluconate 3-dehydrogenase|nr:SDR family oxidoreductase [Lachnospiraceae bacterium]
MIDNQTLWNIDIGGMPARGPAPPLTGLKDVKPLKDILDLTGKTAIVSGGSKGLGLRIVNRLCESGAAVVIADVDDFFGEKAVEFLSAKGYTARYQKTDLRDLNQIHACVDYTVANLGKVDILVNNAAYYKIVKFSDITEEFWDTSLDISLKGMFFMIQAVAVQMIKQGHGGRIVNISSNAGNSMENFYGWMVPYVASKSGVNGITRSLARELKPHGIHINAVVPGGMMSVGSFNMERTPEIEEVQRANPGAPIGDPDNVARVVCMACTEMSDYMDGSIIHADGGTYLGFTK